MHSTHYFTWYIGVRTYGFKNIGGSLTGIDSFKKGWYEWKDLKETGREQAIANL